MWLTIMLFEVLRENVCFDRYYIKMYLILSGNIVLINDFSQPFGLRDVTKVVGYLFGVTGINVLKGTPSLYYHC